MFVVLHVVYVCVDVFMYCVYVCCVYDGGLCMQELYVSMRSRICMQVNYAMVPKQAALLVKQVSQLIGCVCTLYVYVYMFMDMSI